MVLNKVVYAKDLCYQHDLTMFPKISSMHQWKKWNLFCHHGQCHKFA